MSDVRQRRKPTAANGLPAGLASSADGAKATNADGAASAPSPDELLTPKKLQRIDCTKGHVGISCSNHLDPPGVVLDFCDPADLAHKAGLRTGDVVVSVNGTQVITHENLVDAINIATEKGGSDAARFIELEYVDAKAVAASQAAALARRPPQKSLLVAYLLMFCAPHLGLNHLYLGRDGHCALHLASLGGFGLGWWRDLFCLPRYVSLSNEDPESIGQIRLKMISRPVPSRGPSRLLAMVVLGSWFAYVAGCLLPPFDEGEGLLPPLVGVFLEGVAQAVGASVAVFLVGTCPPVSGSFSAALRSGAASAAMVRFLFGWRYGLWAALGAMRGFAGSMAYVRPGAAPQRRVRVAVRTRVATLVGAAALGYGSVGVGLYHHGGVTVGSADGGAHTIMFKDAVHHALQSPLLRKMPSLLYSLCTEGLLGLFSGEFQEAWGRLYDSLDLAGEAHACEKLGLGTGCLEDWSVVKRSYRQLALEFHPDKQADATEERRATAEARFREVQEAYEHLQKLHSSKKAEAEARSGQPEP